MTERGEYGSTSSHGSSSWYCFGTFFFFFKTPTLYFPFSRLPTGDSITRTAFAKISSWAGCSPLVFTWGGVATTSFAVSQSAAIGSSSELCSNGRLDCHNRWLHRQLVLYMLPFHQRYVCCAVHHYFMVLFNWIHVFTWRWTACYIRAKLQHWVQRCVTWKLWKLVVDNFKSVHQQELAEADNNEVFVLSWVRVRLYHKVLAIAGAVAILHECKQSISSFGTAMPTYILWPDI